MKKRYHLLDGIRGLVLISMILYHATWNLVYIYDMDWKWYMGKGAYLWQQSICWTFILLSGFCWSMGNKPLKRGIQVFVSGILVTVVTLLVMPYNRVVFGVLTLIGSCMLLMIPLRKLLDKVKPEIGLIGSLALFIISRNVNGGYLGFETWNILKLPTDWYSNLFTTYLGFTDPSFFSTDYFSLIPWMFLFVTGYFLYGVCDNQHVLQKQILTIKLPFLDFLGRHSLLIYLLHQPILYLGMEVFL